MAGSVLLPYANAYVRVSSSTGMTIVDGRLTPSNPTYKLFRCFLKRAQYSGTSSGSKKQPLPSQLGGEMMPGVAGDAFYYRGYYLQVVTIPAEFDWLVDDINALNFSDVSTSAPELKPGTRVEFLFGTTDPMTAVVERADGVFGGGGIDTILYKELGGVELQLTGAEFVGMP